MKETAPGAAASAPLEEARTLAGQGRIVEAEAIYRKLLDATPELAEGLNFVAMCAHARGESAQAGLLLERARRSAPDDAETLKNLGLVYRALGNNMGAIDALQASLRHEPAYFLARLHLAGLLQQSGRDAEALPHYFRAVKDAQARGRWLNEATTPPGLRASVLHAMNTIDAGRLALFQASFAPLRDKFGVAALHRVEQALAIYLGTRVADYPDPRQKPLFLFFPGIASRPYYDRAQFPWLDELEAATDAIRCELLQMLREDHGFEPFLRTDGPADLENYLRGSQGAPAWNGYFFYRHGERYNDNCFRCPLTIGVLDALPIVRIREHAPEVLFSVLTPGSHILPHRGVTNTRLVTHLPLLVPRDCALRVGGEDHVWREGHCVVFDDTYEHEAWNRSNETRVVLILDTWHPDLTEVERAAVSDLVGAIGEFNQQAGVR